MSISLTTIRYFVTAARYENFSRAANELYMAQSNLSKRIAELERTIGVQLFRRTGRQVRLTEAGRLLHQEWSAVLDRFDQSLRQAQALQQEQDNVLSMGILEGVHVSSLVPQRLEKFQNRNPDITLHMERCGMHRLWQEFDAGQLDMIVTSEVAGVVSPLPPSTVRHVTSTSRGAIAISTRDPLAEHGDLSLPMLRDKSFIAISQEVVPQGYRALQEVCRRAGVPVQHFANRSDLPGGGLRDIPRLGKQPFCLRPGYPAGTRGRPSLRRRHILAHESNLSHRPGGRGIPPVNAVDPSL